MGITVAVGLTGALAAGVLHLCARRLDRPQDGDRRQDGERGFDHDDWSASTPATWSRETISTVMQALRGVYGRRSALAARRSRISLR
jgi:hypothetical protein